MKLNEKQLRKIIEEATSRAVKSEQQDLVLLLIPFICRGEIDFGKTERHGFEITVVSESETPGNSSSYIAWKSVPTEEQALQTAEELSSCFENYITFYAAERNRSYVKSYHSMVHLVGPNTTIYNSSFPVDSGYMFDGVDCSNSELKTMGIL